MKNEQDQLDRLLRSAVEARRSAPAPDDSTVPWTLEQRVLASLRRVAPAAEPGWLLPVIRGAFASASLIVVASAALYFVQPAGQQAVIGEQVPANEMAFADIPVSQMFTSNP